MRFLKVILAGILWLLGLVLPAAATILFAGGEDLDFSFLGAPTISTNTAFFRSSYARAAIGVGAANGSDPATNRILTPTFANQSTIWVHGQVNSGSTATSNNTQWLCVFGSDGVCRLTVRGNGSAGGSKISTRNTAGTQTDLVTCTASSFPAATTQQFDLFLNYAVSGHVTLYIGGVSICDFAGDVTTNSVTAVNQVYFASGSQGTNYWSEMIVSTTDTRSMNLFTCQPVANGTTQNFTGTASSVNPTTINDANSIFTGSNNVIGSFTCPSLVAGTFTVPAVVESVRTQIGTTGPQNFRYSSRPAGSGADFDNGADIAGTTSFTSTQNVWATNPNTSAAWSTTDLGSGVNFGVKSRP